MRRIARAPGLDERADADSRAEIEAPPRDATVVRTGHVAQSKFPSRSMRVKMKMMGMTKPGPQNAIHPWLAARRYQRETSDGFRHSTARAIEGGTMKSAKRARNAIVSLAEMNATTPTVSAPASAPRTAPARTPAATPRSESGGLAGFFASQVSQGRRRQSAAAGGGTRT